MSHRGHGTQKKSRPLRVLVDMDGVLADFESHLLEVYRQKYPDEPFIPLEDRRTFWVADQYKTLGDEDEMWARVNAIIQAKGFFGSIPVIEKSIEAVKDIASLDNTEVFICSSPSATAPHCAAEKIEWITKYMGLAWVDHLILARDKSMVVGDVLIDDRPKIPGINKPMWQHVLFSSCHNLHLDHRKYHCRARLDGWEDREALMKILDDIRKDRA